MQQSNNVDDLLEQWEQVKNTPIPTPCSLTEALEFTRLKNTISDLSRQIRNSRLENDTHAEEYYLKYFNELYDSFSKDFVYRVLKNDKQTQPIYTRPS